MAFSIDTTLANQLLDKIVADIDAGTGAGYVRLYSGTPPVASRTPLNENTMLVEITLANPCAPAASNKQVIFNIVSGADAQNGGVATFFRIFNSDGDIVIQGPVSDQPIVGIQVVSTTVTVGGPFVLANIILTLA